MLFLITNSIGYFDYTVLNRLCCGSNLSDKAYFDPLDIRWVSPDSLLPRRTIERIVVSAIGFGRPVGRLS